MRESQRPAKMATSRENPLSDTSPGYSGKGCAATAWEKGRKLAKNMAIASMAISSAPIVIPPLLFTSTLSVALAIPFGVFFAGYAWTEKLMASLIPPCGTSCIDEDLNREKVIWKELDEIRMIVGLKGNPEPYCSEEVKDLYMFLGIEPPISEDFSHLKNVEEHLQFLKSIIGVK